MAQAELQKMGRGMSIALVTSKIKKKNQIQSYLWEFVQIILDHHEQTNTEVRVICAWFLCLDINSAFKWDILLL